MAAHFGSRSECQGVTFKLCPSMGTDGEKFPLATRLSDFFSLSMLLSVTFPEFDRQPVWLADAGVFPRLRQMTKPHFPPWGEKVRK